MKDKVNLTYNIVQIAPISKFTHHTEELIQQETFYCPCRWGRILYSALKLDFPGLIPNIGTQNNYCLSPPLLQHPVSVHPGCTTECVPI